MRRVNCRIVLTFALALATAGIAASAIAEDARLVATCGAPIADTPPQGESAEPKAAAQYSATCDVRVTDAVAVLAVKVGAKGQAEPLDAKFTPFDAKEQALTAMFLIQVVEPQRFRTAQQMADAVIRIAEAREGKRRFAAYSIANDLTLLAGFQASKADFDKAVRGLRPQTLPTQLYQTTLEAIDKLAKEPGDRKALILVGDGNSDDTGYTHEQVVAAARAANIVIHALGFVEQATEMPRFQLLRRLAEDTGGFKREVRLAREARYNITPKFASEVLENGGTVKINFKTLTGPVVASLNADLGGGKTESAEKTFDIPVPAQPEKPLPEPKPEPGPTTPLERVSAWVKDNTVISYAIGVGFGLAALGFLLFAFGRKPQPLPPVTTNVTKAETPKEKAVIYGWLEMLDGNATRHPLSTTNARIGRHRDNDVCLQNDTISRRHAILHYNPDTKRFVITDLGGDNGVVVNKIRQKSHELNDGDLIELGEVRLRFRPNLEFLGEGRPPLAPT